MPTTAPLPLPDAPAPAAVERVRYDEDLPRFFLTTMVLWGVIAAVVWLAAIAMLAVPTWQETASQLSFASLRPLAVRLLVFGFLSNGLFAASYFALQRLTSNGLQQALGGMHLWGWQAFVVLSLVTSHWLSQMFFLAIWLLYAANVGSMISGRRRRGLFITSWFVVASLVATPLLYVLSMLSGVNGLAGVMHAADQPSWLSGTDDALLYWATGRSLLSFLIVAPVLGVLYYVIPKATGKPIHSYRMAVIHFWSLVGLAVWAGPQNQHLTPLPAGLDSLGMFCGLLMALGGLAGAINLWRSLGMARDMRDDTAVAFMRWSVVAYAVYVVDSGWLSLRQMSASVQYTDWTVANSQLMLLAFAGLGVLGAGTWIWPRLVQTNRVESPALFWSVRLLVIGVAIEVLTLYVAGYRQATMLMGLDETGRLTHPEFVDVVVANTPLLWLRLAGWSIVLLGLLTYAVALLRMHAGRPHTYQPAIAEAVREDRGEPLAATAPHPSPLRSAPVLETAIKLDQWKQMRWHHDLERFPVRMMFRVAILLLIGIGMALLPTPWQGSGEASVATHPYTPLELAGRQIFVREGCVQCHTQTVRPLVAESIRYGDFSRPADSVHDRPSLWGERRVGPDLAREGGKRSHLWHWQHLENPRHELASPGSLMPAYDTLLDQPLDYEAIVALTRRFAAQPDAVDTDATIEAAKAQAEAITADLIAEGGPVYRGERLVLESRGLALLAYLQGLGTSGVDAPATATEPPGSSTPSLPEQVTQSRRSMGGSEARSNPPAMLPVLFIGVPQ